MIDAQAVCEAAAWTRSVLEARTEAQSAGEAESKAKRKADINGRQDVTKADIKAALSRLALAALATDVTEREARAEQEAMQAARLGLWRHRAEQAP